MNKILILGLLLALPFSAEAATNQAATNQAATNQAETNYLQHQRMPKKQPYHRPGRLHDPMPHQPHHNHRPHHNVPEPTSLALLGIGALGLLAARRAA